MNSCAGRDAERARAPASTDVHVGAGTAHVEVGVASLADQRRARRGVEEARARSRGGGAPRADRRTPAASRSSSSAKITESALAVGVHERDRPVVVASALLMIERTGVMPLPPAKATIGTSVLVQHEEARRAA